MSGLPNAYFILGHGSNNIGDPITVPKKCTIVVLAYTGELTYTLEKFYNKIRKMNAININKLKDPVANYGFLLKNFGSVAVFTEGSKCPNFYYNLVSSFELTSEPFVNVPKVNDTINKNFYYSLSGIIEVEDIPSTPIHNEYITAGVIRKKTPAHFLSDLFMNSEYPTSKAARRYLSHVECKNKYTQQEYLEKTGKTINDYKIYKYNDCIQTYKNEDIFKTTQQEICMELDGVFYNFVCRYVPGITSKIYSGPKYNKLHIRPPIEPTNAAYEIDKKNQQKYHKIMISEALLHRKPYVANTYKKRGKMPNTLTVKNIENVPKKYTRLENSNTLYKQPFVKSFHSKVPKKYMPKNNSHKTSRRPYVKQVYNSIKHSPIKHSTKKVKQYIEQIYKEIVHMIDEDPNHTENILSELQNMLSTKRISVEGFALVLGKLLKKGKITVDNIIQMFYLSTMPHELTDRITEILHKKYITTEERDRILHNDPF
jgi:hypothetical protein